MSTHPETLLDAYDRGALDRRGLMLGFAALFGSVAGSARVATEQPTFRATGLDHIALEVTDVARSTAFYQRHLGLRPTSESASSAFLDCGDQFVALFQSARPGLAHYSYALADYSQSSAAEKLRAAGLRPKLRGNRTYFDDPDGIEVQVSRG
jgi:catechol-2,3-dioxygenase